MIDTEKYEGHRQPWVFTAGVSYPMSKADMALRHDAPLLLAEVKRLRKAYEVMGEALREHASDYCEHCLRVYRDTSDEVLYRHREGRCLT